MKPIRIPQINSLTSNKANSHRSLSYSRFVKISNQDGTTIFNLKREDDGSLMEFREIQGPQTAREIRKGLVPKETQKAPEESLRLVHKRIVSLNATPDVGNSLNSLDNSIMPGVPQKSNFYGVVSKVLDNQLKQLSEEQKSIKEEKASWFKDLNKGGRIKFKIPMADIKRKLSIDLKMLKPDEREIIKQYKHEILGNYTTSEGKLEERILNNFCG